MLRSFTELWFALSTCILIGGIYGGSILLNRQIPAASDFWGHLIGIIGFILMLMTETLYSLRKRSRLARWGRMADWLKFHIFTGIVGPFMVLLHASWKLNGLAGIVLLMTGVIVLSGFMGRYIYTRIPRTADGIEDASIIGQMQAGMLANARRLFALWHTIHIPIGVALFTAAFAHILGALYFATFLK
jgi:predicted membrane channel-forming protein YqfA (hemolysin III family)